MSYWMMGPVVDMVVRDPDGNVVELRTYAGQTSPPPPGMPATPVAAQAGPAAGQPVTVNKCVEGSGI